VGRSLSHLAASMRRKAEQVPEIGNRLSIAGTRAMLRELVEITPVDTSEAISNWQVGVGVAPPTPLPPHVFGRRGSSRGASSTRSIDEGEAALAMKKPGQRVYLSNTAAHIVDLDRGSSTQFAGGFVSRALIIFHLAMQTAKKQLWK